MKHFQVKLIMLSGCFLFIQTAYSALSSNDKNTLKLLATTINSKDYEKAKKHLSTLSQSAQKKVTAFQKELDNANHPNVAKHLTASPVAALNELTEFVDQIEAVIKPVIEKCEKFLITFADEISFDLQQWLGKKPSNQTVSENDFLKQWSKILDVLKKSNASEALTAHTNVVLPFKKITYMKKNAKNALIDSNIAKVTK